MNTKSIAKNIFEVNLPRRVIPQPIPHLAKIGDCSYCCLAGIMQCSLEEAYHRCDQNAHEGATWSEFKKNLHTLKRKGYIDRIIDNVPIWPGNLYEGHMSWGAPSTQMSLSWFNYVLMALDAGYYGFCSVSYKERKFMCQTDHKILLCGARSVLIEEYEGTKYKFGIYRNEILISCSSTDTLDEQWIDVRDFLSEWGGFNIQLARPVPTKFLT